MNVYSRGRPLLFLAFAPAVLASIAMLLLPSLGGLIIVIGLFGLLGLSGLLGAWLALLSPALFGRWKGISILFLMLGVVIAVLAVTIGTGVDAYDPSWTGGFAGTAASYGVLSSWFVCALSDTPEARGRMTMESIVLALIVAIGTAVVPVAGFVGSRGYVNDIWRAVGTEGERQAKIAQDAIDAYTSSHDGAMPADNHAAGLPPPTDLHSRYVYSVTVREGVITVVYGNDPIATLFGADTLGFRLTVAPVDKLSLGGMRAWSCISEGSGRYGAPMFTGVCAHES